MKGSIALSTGGSGGHVFPAICLAQELMKRDYHIVWCTDQRGDKYFTSSVDPNFKSISSFDKLIFHISKEEGTVGKIKQYLTIARATFKILNSFIARRPDFVVGFGGYTTAPVVIAASFLRIPIILHEQNAVLGKVNRWMARHAKVMVLGFEHTQRIPSHLKTTYVGNPVRADIARIRDQAYPAITDKLKILVIGGSQGAALFSTIIPAAIALLPTELQQRIEIVQQARKEFVDTTMQAYQDLKVKAIIEPFFTNMADLYNQTHLVICRAGAMTVAEVCLAHRPAIFVPLASAMDNHQYFNAAELSTTKLAWLIKQSEFTAKKLSEHLQDILNNPTLLEEISGNLQKKYRVDATVKLANYLEDLLPKKK